MELHVINQEGLISNRNELKPRLALLDGTSSANEMFNKILVADYIAYAMDNDTVVGTYCYGIVNENNPCFCPELLEHLVPEDKLVFNINIYIRLEYRGNNLVLELEKVLTQYANERGFTHAVGYFPETEEIKSWREAQPNTIIIRPTSTNVDWISLRALDFSEIKK